MSGIKKILLLTSVSIILLFSGFVLPAHARHRSNRHNTNEDPAIVQKYDVNVELTKEAKANVTLALDMDFSRKESHGPYLTLPTRQRTNDPGKWLDLGVKIIGVESPSGANTHFTLDNSDGVLGVRIGEKGTLYSGVQRYIIKYQLTGLVAQNQGKSGLDEFNWNVIGPAWATPIYEVSARLTGPAEIVRVACFRGEKLNQPCQAVRNYSSAEYRTDTLMPKTPVQIVAGFPAGTFSGVTQTFSKRFYIGNMFPLNPLTGGVTVILIIGSCFLVRRTMRRHFADQVYLGLAPGVRPGSGGKTRIGFRPDKVPPVAVQFRPPKDAHPGELGTLLDSKADNVDVIATIIDLAVRRYLIIIPLDSSNYVFRVTNKSWDDLLPYESGILSILFQSGPEVSLNDLKNKDYASLLPKSRELLYKRVVNLGWFRKNPNSLRNTVFAIAIGLILAGLFIGGGAAFIGWGLIGLSGICAGLLVLIWRKRFSARTADGSAVLAETKGFELYLSTAEANQIRFEEGVDVFSRYLPYAIIFGVTNRWVKVFKDLEQQGLYFADTSWYGGITFDLFSVSAFENSMNGLSQSMSEAMSEAVAAESAGSSGGSGFDGGGGFGGGGGGSW